MFFLKKYKGIDEAKQISLSTEEKSAMRVYLEQYADNRPVEDVQKINIFTHIFTQRAYGVAVLMCIIGGGVVYASEEALPGDVLYVAKVAIREPVEGLFINGIDAEITWQEQKAIRRLKEVEMLAHIGVFDEKKRVVVEKSFDDSVEQFAKINAKIEKELSEIDAKKKKYEFEARVALQLEKVRAKKQADELRIAQNIEIELLEQKVRQKLAVIHVEDKEMNQSDETSRGWNKPRTQFEVHGVVDNNIRVEIPATSR